ncbi:MAG: response regulator [Actinomycetota bacterium]|nr:response regulator [Acidimicrobiales bacterium]MEC8815627.1 response regulator [Actinomycetota bacterium]MEC8970244.1 response regulator [Actinomycetota bacterium]MEC8983206.1 response regulator [Actinomycetota bacterium]MEC9426479.1 response regulator [Actinomycetota bacterium]
MTNEIDSEGIDAVDLLRPVRVVLAEDEAIIRLDLRETLEDEGYQIVGDTGRGDHAVDLVAELDPDVVILDIKMPGLDGIEAARRIAASHDAAVVILTAFSQRDLINQAIEAGALAYLVKPFQRSELVPAVEVALARHREMRALTDQARTLAELLEARKVIDRAKGLLMDEAGMTEDQAFGFIRSTAMSGRRTMADVARAVIEEGLRP